MKRRDFITILGGATASWMACPLAAAAQHAATPIIGFLHPQSPEGYVEPMRAFREGLKEVGYAEGENVAIDYRWADNQPDRLPVLAADLVRRRAAVIVTPGGPVPALAAKTATTTTPIVFVVGDDPVKRGLVASLSRPGGNLTGINVLSIELAAKRLEILREIVGRVTRVAVLVNPLNVQNTELTLRDMETAARSIGVQYQVLNADNAREIDAAFESVERDRPDGLFVAFTSFFVARRIQLVQLAAFHKIPATYGLRDFAESGGLISYGANLSDGYRQAGVYAGRILKGAKPADIPVMQSNRLELVINRQTARMLGVTVPATLLASADEVIE